MRLDLPAIGASVDGGCGAAPADTTLPAFTDKLGGALAAESAHHASHGRVRPLPLRRCPPGADGARVHERVDLRRHEPVVDEEEEYVSDSLHEALDDVRFFRCKYCSDTIR